MRFTVVWGLTFPQFMWEVWSFQSTSKLSSNQKKEKIAFICVAHMHANLSHQTIYLRKHILLPRYHDIWCDSGNQQRASELHSSARSTHNRNLKSCHIYIHTLPLTREFGLKLLLSIDNSYQTRSRCVRAALNVWYVLILAGVNG